MSEVVLRDPHSAVTATFLPGAGMVGTSLRDDGVELLGQVQGVQRYVDDGVFMGLPLMHPWANRLREWTYAAEGRTVTLTPESYGLDTDPNGLVIHGLLTSYPGWVVTAVSDHELSAELDFGADSNLLRSFPFPHRLMVSLALSARTLRVRAELTAAGVAVPVCFGFHPYLQIPGAPRAQWVVELPARRHLELDGHLLPTGAAAAELAEVLTLGDSVFDDAYDQVADGAVFAVSGGGRRIEVTFEQGYAAAQIYAPDDDDVVCFEPMTAPTDSLSRGDYPRAEPGQTVAATFSIRV